MKKGVIKVLYLFSLMLFASCGKELPDNLNNYEVNKEGNNGKQDLSTPIKPGAPAENDNPLPTY